MCDPMRGRKWERFQNGERGRLENHDTNRERQGKGKEDEEHDDDENNTL